jgi:hypothetical protein
MKKKPVKKTTKKGKHPGGRPEKITISILNKLEEAFLLGCTDEEACLSADISPRTLYKYQERNPEFIQRKELLKNNPVYKARKSVVESIEGDPELALKFLERKKKDEFSLRHELGGIDNKPLPPIEIKILGRDDIPTKEEDTSD